MNFETLDRWFDQLTSQEQDEIRNGHEPLEKLPQSLLPAEQGRGLEANLRGARKRFEDLAADGRPFYLARISDCEVVAMGSGYLAHSPHPQKGQAHS